MAVYFICLLLWVGMLYLDVEEYLQMKREWGEAHKTFMIADLMFIGVIIFAIVKG